MYSRTLLAALPLSLLASCGDSEPAPQAQESSASLAASESAAPAAEVTGSIAASSDAPTAAALAPTPSQAATAAPAATPAAIAVAAAPPPEFAVCRACHSVEPGKNGVGPTLFGIAGSKAGEVPGYSFSPALKASGITWNRDTLDKWLAGPMKMVPGTKMVIAVPDPAKRKAIIAYLEQLK